MDRDQPQQNPDHLRSRLENEVLDILQRADVEPGRVVKFKSRAQRERTQRLRQVRGQIEIFRLTPLQLLGGFLLLAVLATFVDHSSPLLARLFALTSIVCLGAVYVQSFRQPKITGTKRWRGRDIDLNHPSDLDWRGRFRGRRPPKR